MIYYPNLSSSPFLSKERARSSYIDYIFCIVLIIQGIPHSFLISMYLYNSLHFRKQIHLYDIVFDDEKIDKIYW